MASEEHLKLSEFIKTVHQDLRRLSKRMGASEAWNKHCENESILKEYASVMQRLATNHWVKESSESVTCQSRIEWVYNHCKDYFFNGRRLESIEKEIEMAKKHEIPVSRSTLHLGDHGSTLKLLDVGSCYNPFKQFGMFDVTAIDLCPANVDVIRCDFLQSRTIENDNCDGILVDEEYSVIVFSLLLEYLPCPRQRYACCSKAYRLLKPSGLLFIVTPDSKHATANSKLMKTWRICLASLGFTRIYYEKLKHLHCMAFKKAVVRDLTSRWFAMKNIDSTDAETMLKIPQDSVEKEPRVKTENTALMADRAVVAEIFGTLPQDV